MTKYHDNSEKWVISCFGSIHASGHLSRALGEIATHMELEVAPRGGMHFTPDNDSRMEHHPDFSLLCRSKVQREHHNASIAKSLNSIDIMNSSNRIEVDYLTMFHSSMSSNSVEYTVKDSNDLLFAPISDIESIFDDESSPIPSHESIMWQSKTATEAAPYCRMFDVNNFVEKSYPSMSYQHVPDRIPADENLSAVLDELDDITSDLGPDEFAAISAETCMTPLLTPFVSAPLSFKHLKPCQKTKRRVVSDESSSENALNSNHSTEVKRQRVDKEVEEDDESGIKFRFYQAEKWHVKFGELVEYKRVHGHCQVPHGYRANPTLARWAKRQRYQYKLYHESKPSTMTEERIADLEKLGFVWDSHTALWEERYNELNEFVQSTGSANVPSTYPPNPKLAIWVKCQRRQYKLLVSGQASNMTHARVQLLNKLNFIWEIRRTGYLS